MKKINVALLFGGRSAEHEVSVKSARNIAAALDKSKYNLVLIGISKEGTWYSVPEMGSETALLDKNASQSYSRLLFSFEEGRGQFLKSDTKNFDPVDIVFPILHGTYGEDGCVQGFLKMLNIPFVGCGVLSSAAGMDKDVMKKIFTHAGIPNSPYILLRPWLHPTFDEISKTLGTPFFIKPANAGSSVGVHKIRTEEDFKTKLKDSFLYDSKVLAEKFIPGREIEISVLGLGHNPKVSEPGEVKVLHDFYSYEAKYLDEQGAEIIIPAILPEATKHQIKALAAKAFTAIDGSGFARIDFFVKESGEIYINEINTLPGFTNISMYPKMWEQSGIQYSDLITRIIELGLEQHRIDQSIKTNWSTN